MFRILSAIFEPRPLIGCILKHRDIDLFLKVVGHDGIGSVHVTYGFLDDNNKFLALPNRATRKISRFSLHYRYDQV